MVTARAASLGRGEVRATCWGEDEHEDQGIGSPCCSIILPRKVVRMVKDGSLDCPRCGWREGRCRHCNELLVRRWDAGAGVARLECYRHGVVS